MFSLFNNDMLQGVLCSNVNAFCWGGTEIFQSKIIKMIKDFFNISREELETLTYIQLNIVQSSGFIKIDQNSYINNLKKV